MPNNSMKISQIISENEKEFEKRVADLKNTETDIDDSVEFGYRTQRGDEVFKVVDFGNIQKFFLFSQTNLIKGLIEEVEGMKQKLCMACRQVVQATGHSYSYDALQKVIDYLKDGIEV